MQKEKAIIFDLDGTAIDSPGQKLPSKELVRAADNLKNEYYLSAATGRVWTFAKPVLQALGLTDPSIISAGTQICDPKTGEILWQRNIPEKSLEQVMTILQTNPDYKLLFNDSTEDDYFHGGITPKEFSHKEPVYFLEQVFVPDSVAVPLYEKLSKVDGVACVMVVAQKPGCRDIHILNEHATKEHAVGELLNMLHVENKNSIGIGDSHNDVHLFNAVGHRVAMGNSIPELKAAADVVIGSVEDDGLAQYFNSLLHK